MDWLPLFIVGVLLRLANCLMERFVRRYEAGNRRALAITFPDNIVILDILETLGGCLNIQDIMAILEEMISRAPGGVHHADQTGGRTSDPGASSSHGVNMSINGSEQLPRETEENQQDLYFDKGSALAGVCCCLQLGGLTGADFSVSKLLPAACYIAVAAVAFMLSLFVLIWCHDLPPGVRRFCLIVTFFFLFLEYWIIKPLLP